MISCNNWTIQQDLQLLRQFHGHHHSYYNYDYDYDDVDDDDDDWYPSDNDDLAILVMMTDVST